MLERVNFAQEPRNKSEVKEAHKQALDELVLLQQEARKQGLGVVVLFEGWDGSGKGSRISDLLYKLDARLTQVHVTQVPSCHDLRAFSKRYPKTSGYYPVMQEFWQALGPRGTMTLYDRGWLAAAVYRELSASQLKRTGELTSPTVFQSPSAHFLAHQIEDFERQLADDGYLVVKFFLHIRQDEQRRRLEKLSNNPDTAWRVSTEELHRLDDYERLYRYYDELVRHTNFDFASWKIINGEEKRAANLEIVTHLCARIKQALAQGKDSASEQARLRAQENSQALQAQAAQAAVHEDGQVASKADGQAVAHEDERAAAQTVVQAQLEPSKTPEACVNEDLKQQYQKQADLQHSQAPVASRFVASSTVPSLSSVCHSLSLERLAYKQELKAEQEELYKLQLALYQKRRPLILLYEGWDAAGKGGNIKRVAQALDARAYTIFPSPAPSAFELAHPHLWRYWTRLPKAGHVGIYDRSWYGRVLVERVEGFASVDEWARAYDEINSFEWALTHWGAIVCKFWIDISPEEQLARFAAREQDPSKAWKITEEDWRNREKYPLYYAAVEDMFRLTSTQDAPWHVLEGDSKYFARVKALRIINSRLKAELSD